jgi:cell division septation protein DedD
VSELTHDAEDGFHEIQLSGKQLVFLFMATTVVSVVIFLCGVLVGRGVRAERGGEDLATVAAAPAPVAEPQAAEIPAPAPEPPPPAAEPLTAHERLQQKTAPAEELKKAPEPASVEVPAAGPPKTPAARPVDAAPAAATVANEGSGPQPGSWVIQVHALQNRDAANAFVRSLSSKGYPAFLLNPAPDSPQIYRVQIGAYREREEAESIARRLEKEEQFRPAVKRR